jgi:hypothetical protein
MCDAMYDFVFLSVKRSVRDSHLSRDYRDGTGIRVLHYIYRKFAPIWHFWEANEIRWGYIFAPPHLPHMFGTIGVNLPHLSHLPLHTNTPAVYFNVVLSVLQQILSIYLYSPH